MSTDPNALPEQPKASNFVRDILLAGYRQRQARRPRAYALPSGAERLSAHRPRQVHLPELRPRPGVRRQVQPALRRHQPGKEETEYVDSIIEDVRWLGGDWEDRLFYASDYFQQLYEWAVVLIKKGKAYVCDLTAEEVREHRGTLTEPGKQSPYRNRSVEENLDLFERMKNGEFPDGAAHAARQDRHGVAQHEHARPGHVPHPARRAPPHRRQVVHLSDVRLRPRPVATRSRASRTRSARWSSKTIARSTTGTSRQLGIFAPQQIEFARLNLHLHPAEQAQAAEAGERKARVNGWDDPRMPTLTRPAPPRLHARGDSQASARASASRRPTASWTRPAGASPARGPEQARPRASWPCCGR